MPLGTRTDENLTERHGKEQKKTKTGLNMTSLSLLCGRAGFGKNWRMKLSREL